MQDRLEFGNILIFLCYLAIIIFSIPANSFILLSILIYKDLRTPVNLLVCNLSAAGLAISVLHIPWKLTPYIYPREVFLQDRSIHFCRFIQIIPGACVISISLTLFVICTDRYIAIIHPMKRHWKMTSKRVYIFLTPCWIAAFGMASVYILYLRIVHIFNRSYCLSLYPESLLDINITDHNGNVINIISFNRSMYWLLFIAIAFLLPTITMLCLYSVIARRLWFHQHPSDQLRTLSLKDQSNQLKQNRRVIKILIICFAIFVLTNLPFYVIVMLVDLRLLPISSTFGLINRILSMINLSAVAFNPIIYGFSNKSITDGIHRLLLNLCCVRQLPPTRTRNGTIKIPRISSRSFTTVIWNTAVE